MKLGISIIFWSIPRKERVKQSVVRPVTSPRLWGEVGIRTLAPGKPSEGQVPVPGDGLLCKLQEAPHPDPLPASGARERSTAGMTMSG